MRPLEPVERQEPARRVAPPDARHGDPVVVGEVSAERLGVPRLLLVVELEADRAAELVDELVGVDEVELADALADDARRRGHELQIGLDLPRREGTLNLDDHLRVVRERRAVHLTDRRGGDRPLLEVDERPLDRQPELGVDDALHVLDRERRHLVLELPQLGDHVGRHEVGPCREQLPELDERRPELVQHLPEPPSSIGIGRLGRASPVEEVAEAVPRRHAADLGDAREAPLRRLGHASAYARVVALEQAQAVLELRHAEREIVDVLASRETRLREPLLDRLVAPIAQALELVTPRCHGVSHRPTHRVAIDTDAPGEVVGDLVGRFEPEARPADPGEQQLGDGARALIAVLAHRGGDASSYEQADDCNDRNRQQRPHPWTHRHSHLEGQIRTRPYPIQGEEKRSGVAFGYDRPTAAPAVQRRDRGAEGPGRRGRLEHPRPGAGRRSPTPRTRSGATATPSSPAAPRSSSS